MEETKKGNKAKGKQEERQEERNYEDSDDTELQSTRAWMQEWPSGGSSDEEPEARNAISLVLKRRAHRLCFPFSNASFAQRRLLLDFPLLLLSFSE